MFKNKTKKNIFFCLLILSTASIYPMLQFRFDDIVLVEDNQTKELKFGFKDQNTNYKKSDYKKSEQQYRITNYTFEKIKQNTEKILGFSNNIPAKSKDESDTTIHRTKEEYPTICYRTKTLLEELEATQEEIKYILDKNNAKKIINFLSDYLQPWRCESILFNLHKLEYDQHKKNYLESIGYQELANLLIVVRNLIKNPNKKEERTLRSDQQKFNIIVCPGN